MPIRTFLRINWLFFLLTAGLGSSFGFAISYAISGEYWRLFLWTAMTAVYVPLVVREARLSAKEVHRFFFGED